MDLRIGVEACGLEARLHHAQAAVWENGALERLVGLQPDDHLVVAVDIAGLVGEQRRRRLGIDGEHAFLPLLREIGLELLPHGLGSLGRADQEFLVAPVRRGIADDEIAHIDRGAPATRHEIAPAALVLEVLG